MMNEKNLTIGTTVALPKVELDHLLADLRSNGYQTVGPRLQDECIVYKEIEGLHDLPRGLLSEQKPASYRLIQTGQDRYFDFIPAGQSWKQFLFPPRQHLFTAQKTSSEGHAPGRTAKWQIKAEDAPTSALRPGGCPRLRAGRNRRPGPGLHASGLY